MQPMQTNRLTTLLTGIEAIPTLPATIGRVTKTIADPDSSARDLMQIIAPDQALTLNILKIANSAIYGRVRKVSTLEQATAVLGFEEIRNIVVSTVMFNNFSRLKAAPLFDLGKFWEHAFVCGLAARIIAKDNNLPAGDMFVAGLLHDIGKLAICMVLPKAFNKVVESAGNNNLKTSPAELKILGLSHAEVGAYLVKRWMLPQGLVTAVEYHHRPGAAFPQTAYPVVIHLADQLAHMVTTKEAPEGGQSRDNRLTPDIVSLARSQGTLENQDSFKKYAEELAVQKEAQAGILEVFLS
jgi:HD-like signal output (HDOD) protein